MGAVIEEHPEVQVFDEISLIEHGVRTAISHGKFKRQGRFIGQRSDWKKAYVKLKDGEKIPEFLEGA